MVIDAAKGIEARTRKLFEVCRLRDIPIMTFINKMDRESRDPFDLLDEIEKTLALDTAPITWPIGRGRDFVGTIEVETGGVGSARRRCRLAGRLREMTIPEVAALNPNLDAAAIAGRVRSGARSVQAFDLESFREGPFDARCSSAARSRISASAICSTRSAPWRRRRARNPPTSGW